MDDSSPRRSNFHPIHLDRSFSEVLCKWSLRPLRATVPTPSPSSKMRYPSPPSQESFANLPHGSTFRSFRFCERASLPLPMFAFQLYDPPLQMDNERS
ncbi:hypothetical protein AVEN_165802-1 [Araneus ventricosus]|uniref:Uncharacterized protein n=1 Tax=Araneus ventricosus TaxID=182803 RepID=A0A4Y2EPD9_ARAVE|nr:hypothetical protein AVEN_165802-1 [Araneus ventricosus]